MSFKSFYIEYIAIFTGNVMLLRGGRGKAMKLILHVLFMSECFLYNILRKYFKNQPLEVFCKKGVFKNFAEFLGKHPCRGLFFNQVASFRCSILLLKWRQYRCFSLNFAKFLRTPLQNISRRLFLYFFNKKLYLFVFIYQV